MANKGARAWCFTINNPTDEDLLAVSSVVCRYIIYGNEVGEEGTPHLQGYVEFEKVIRMNACKKSLGDRAHIEPRRGTREQARDYCMKDGNFVERGDFGAGGQGKRNDLETLMQAVKEDKPRLEIMEEIPMVYARNEKFLHNYKAALMKEKTKDFRFVTVNVLWGDAGVGKTRRVMELTYGKVFRVNVEDSFPFDGYDYEEAILFDDFYGGLKINNMLHVLDGYQLRLNVKHGHSYANWKTVYITSNRHPDTWYPNVDPRVKKAFDRRISSIEFVGDKNELKLNNHFWGVTEFCNEVPVILERDPVPVEAEADGISEMNWKKAFLLWLGTMGDEMYLQQEQIRLIVSVLEELERQERMAAYNEMVAAIKAQKKPTKIEKYEGFDDDFRFAGALRSPDDREDNILDLDI